MRKLYWVDALEDKIECSDLDGRKRTQIITHAAHPFAVTIFDSKIYWTDWHNKSVLTATKTGNKVEEVRHGLSGALDIRAVSQQRQPNDWTPCADNNGGCTHLCLYRHSSYVCHCPDIPDTKICKLDPEFVVPLREENLEHDNDPEYEDAQHNLDSNDALELNYKARIVIIATGILGGLLIIVVAAILCELTLCLIPCDTFLIHMYIMQFFFQ